jgi:hypothetical protein
MTKIERLMRALSTGNDSSVVVKRSDLRLLLNVAMSLPASCVTKETSGLWEQVDSEKETKHG